MGLWDFLTGGSKKQGDQSQGTTTVPPGQPTPPPKSPYFGGQGRIQQLEEAAGIETVPSEKPPRK